MIVLAFGQITIFTYLNLNENVKDDFLIAFFGSLFFYNLYGIGFLVIMSLIYHQFKAFHEVLVKSSVEFSLQSQEIDTFKLEKFLKKIRRFHDDLTDIIDAISSYFLINSLIFNFCFFSFCIFFIYTVYVTCFDPETEILIFLLSVSLFVCLYLPYFFWSGAVSNLTEKKAKKIVEIVQELSVSSKSKKMLKMSESLVLQSSHRRIIIASALYEIDWKYVFVVFVAIFNYSIILIQFYDVEKPKKS
jgi:hypothetical protein